MSDAVEATEASPDEPKGIDGWLLLPLIGLIGSLLYTVWLLFDRTFPELATRAPRNLLAAAVSLVLVTLPFFLFQVYCLVRFLQKRREVPWLMTILYGLNILTLLTLIIAKLKGYEFPDQVAAHSVIAGHPLLSIVQIGVCAGYIAYFHESVRVKNTFVNVSPLRPEPKGLGGWLLLPIAFILVVTGIGFFTGIKHDLPVTMVNAIRNGAWSTLARNIFGFLLILYSVFCLYCLAYQLRLARWLTLAYFVLFTGAMSSQAIIRPERIKGSLIAAAINLVFLLYFLFSKRVKNTFVR